MDIELFLSQDQSHKIIKETYNCQIKCLELFYVPYNMKNTVIIEVADENCISKIKNIKQATKEGVSIYLTGSSEREQKEPEEVEESQIAECLKDRMPCSVKLLCYNYQTYDTTLRILKVISSPKSVNPEEESLLPDASEIPSGLMSRVKESPEETYDPLVLYKYVLAAAHIVLKNKEILELRKAVNRLNDDLSKANVEIDKLRDLLSNDKYNDEKYDNLDAVKKKRRVVYLGYEKGAGYIQVKCRRLEDYRLRSYTKFQKYREEILDLQRSKFALEDELHFYKFGGAMYKTNGNL